jgi:hypothetical protein
MDALQHKTKLALALATVLVLSACSKEGEPPAVNQEPTITVNSAVVALEGEMLEIPFEISDGDHSSDELKVVLSTQGVLGNVTVDKDAGVLRYTGPWVSTGDSRNDGFSVSVVDPAGAKASVDISVRVDDINSPVTITISPPAQAFGFQNTRTDENINFLYPESGQLEMRFDLIEKDVDELISSFSISPEGTVFENQVTFESSDDGTQVVFTLPVPNIATSSEQFSFIFSIDDGDALVSSTANVTLVNRVGLNWADGAPSTVSESDGAVLRYLSTESYSYPASYEAVITMLDGTPLDFPLDYSLSSSTGEVVIQPSDGFQGGRSALLTLRVSNVITNVGGEEFVEETLLTRQLSFVDDRDDDFNIRLNGFFSDASLLDDLDIRRDEVRIGNSVSNYLFFNRFITHAERINFLALISDTLSEEFDVLSTAVANISTRVDAGESGAQIESDIADFAVALRRVGRDTREVIVQNLSSITAVNDDKTLPFGDLSISGTSTLFDSRLTHFVGNGMYGSFADEAKEVWRFNDEYAYLSVADISDPFCF